MLNLLDKKKIIKEADYFLNQDITIRELSQILKRSKSAIHKDLNNHLSKINPEKYKEVKKKLETHKTIRHIKGGESTKLKYQKAK